MRPSQLALTQHRLGDVDADPAVALLLEALAGEAGAAAKVQDEAGMVGKGQKLDGSFGHFILDVDNSGALR
jgi:hypothetical protein